MVLARPAKPDRPVPPPADAPGAEFRDGRREAWRPSSDEAWLVEMMAQRLEVEMAAARARRVWGLAEDAAREKGRQAAFTEMASRAGLSPAVAAEFYAAQVRAARVAAAQARKRAEKEMRAGALLLPPGPAESLLDAIESQMAATLLRLRGVPSEAELSHYGFRTLQKRGVPARAARLAAEPLRPARAASGAFAISEAPP